MLAAATTNVNRTVAAEANGTVAINAVAGSVAVVAGASSEVMVTGTLGGGVERLDVERQGARVDIRVVVPRTVNSMSRRDAWARLVITVPAGSALDIATVSADVSSNGTGGVIDVRSVSGDVQIEGTAQASGRVRVRTVNGNVRAQRIGGSLEASSTSGDIRAGMAPVQLARLRSTSGDIALDGRLAATGRAELETVSGDVTVAATAEDGIAVDAASFSGDITACFPAQITGPASRSNPGKRLDARVGAGSARLTAKSLSGDIRLCDRAP